MSLVNHGWPAHKAFYDSLMLRSDGDVAERLGATQYGIDTAFPNYERFWRYHVAPATQRPGNALLFRFGIHDSVIAVVQGAYTVFSYLLEANEYLAQLKKDDLGPRCRNWYNTVIYAGNAIQVIESLQVAVESKLAAALGQSINVFPDWKATWNPGREGIINFRNYVTHKGVFQIFVDSSRPYVLARSEVTRKNSPDVTWTHSVTDFATDKSRFVECRVAGQEIVAESTDWLNRAFGRFCDTLDPFLPLSAYQALWGWNASGSPVVPASQPTQMANTGQSGVVIVPANMCGMTCPLSWL